MYPTLVWLAKWEVILLVGGIASIIALRLLTGGINLQNLFYGVRRDGTRYFSPERVQLLIATIAVGMQYLLAAVNANSGEMPRVPDGMLELFGLSQAIYLGGKGWTAFRKTDSN